MRPAVPAGAGGDRAHYLHVQELIRQDAVERFVRACSGTIKPDDPLSNCKVIPLLIIKVMFLNKEKRNGVGAVPFRWWR